MKLKRLLGLGIVLAFAAIAAGCSALSSSKSPLATAQAVMAYQPPTQSNLAKACQVANPAAADTIVCDQYKANVAMCQANLQAIGGVFQGVAAFVPNIGSGVAEGISVATTMISGEQAWWCADLGYIQKVQKAEYEDDPFFMLILPPGKD